MSGLTPDQADKASLRYDVAAIMVRRREGTLTWIVYGCPDGGEWRRLGTVAEVRRSIRHMRRLTVPPRRQ